jgi:hypothetical protein
MLGKFTKHALLGGLVLVASMAMTATAFAEATAYGNVNFNAIYQMTNNDAAGAGNGGLDPSPPQPDTAGDTGGGTIHMHSRPSKFGVKGSMDSDAGKITGVIEVDAAGRAGPGGAWGASSSAPDIRLRHAYGTVGNLLVGRTWGTLATDFSWFPTTLDAWGAYGASVVFSDPRMSQVRYTLPIGDNKLVLSAEENTGVDAAIFGDRPSLPRIVGWFDMMAGPAKVQVVVAMTTWQFNETGKDVNDTYTAAKDLDGNGADDDVITVSGTMFGVNAAAGVGPGTLKFHYYTGAGGFQMNSILILGGSSFGFYQDGEDFKPVSSTDMTLSYNMKLDDMSQVNATYGSVAINDDVDTPSSATAAYCSGCVGGSGTSIHLNYIRTIAPGVNWGVEYATKTITYDDNTWVVETGKSAASGSASNSAVIFSMNVGF